MTIQAGVTSLCEQAFWRCHSLSSVTIPAGVTGIGNHAFGWTYDVSSSEERRYEGFTVYGAAGSAAQTYAEENGFQFVKTN